MSKPDERLVTMVEDTLARVSTLGMTDRDIERGAGLPAAFLAKTRAGANRNARAAVSWGKLRAWLTTQGHAGKKLEAVAGPPAPGAPAVAETTIAQDIAKARTARKCGALLLRIGVEVAEDRMEPKTAETLERIIARKLAALKLERLERAAKQVRALEIHTPAEAALIRAHREGLAGPPLKPGEMVPPPIETEEAKA